MRAGGRKEDLSIAGPSSSRPTSLCPPSAHVLSRLSRAHAACNRPECRSLSSKGGQRSLVAVKRGEATYCRTGVVEQQHPCSRYRSWGAWGVTASELALRQPSSFALVPGKWKGCGGLARTRRALPGPSLGRAERAEILATIGSLDSLTETGALSYRVTVRIRTRAKLHHHVLLRRRG